jgi:hypothetical protein
MNNRTYKNIKINTIKIVLFFFVSIVFISCSSSKPVQEPECTKGKKIIVRWGDLDNIAGTVEKYELNEKGEVLKFKGKINSTDMKFQKIGVLDPVKYCDLMIEVKTAVLKTQSLNAPGEKQRFIEYISSNDDNIWRGTWNSKYQAAGSVHLRDIYDKLESLKPLIENNMGN